MPPPLTFDSIKNIESHLPRPIASVLNRARIAEKTDLGGRHKKLLDLFECFIKLLCIVQLQEAHEKIANLKDKLPQKEKTLEFLKRPSLGSWVGLLRIMCKIECDNSQLKWMPKIAQWYNQQKNTENAEAMLLLKELKGVSFNTRSRIPNAEICNALVTYRNKQHGHAASLHHDELAKRLPVLEGILCHLLKHAEFLQEMKFSYVKRIEVAENNRWLIHSSLLNGINEEPTEFISQAKLDLSEIYLGDAATGNLEEKPIPLGPFMLWQSNEDLMRREIYLYNDAWRTKLEYISYMSGSHYYHTELHGRFADLVTLKLKPGVEEDSHRHLTPEERAESAEHYYKRSRVLTEQGQLEDALEALEIAVEYNRCAGMFLEMAKIQQRLGDPPEAIQQMLQNCFDANPTNEEFDKAMAFRADLQHDGVNTRVIDRVSDHEDPNLIKNPCIWQALTPRLVRKFAALWWSGILIGWYGFSIMCEYVNGDTNGIIVNIMQLCCSMVGIVGIILARPLLLRIKLPLSLQLDSMRLDRFEAWFEKQMQNVFGAFIFRQEKLNLKQTFRMAPLYFSGYLIWVLCFSVIGIVLTEIHRLPPLIFVKRYVDNILVLGVAAYPFVRYVVTSTLFVYALSKLSLKPMLTRINDDGLRSLGPLITVNIILLSFIWVALFGFAAMEISLQWYGDFFLVAIGVAIVAVWSVGMPLMIRRAAREAKSKAVHAYSEHIEKSFTSFLGEPDEDKLKRYQWLVENQKTIVKISTWPLSFKETVITILLGNVLVSVVSAWYILFRVGQWPILVEKMRVLFMG